MKKKYEYRVCQVQAGSVTFVNGAWQGHGLASEAVQANDPQEGCPKVWDFLNMLGSDGWELVAATPRHPEEAGEAVLYLRKEMFG